MGRMIGLFILILAAIGFKVIGGFDFLVNLINGISK